MQAVLLFVFHIDFTSSVPPLVLPGSAETIGGWSHFLGFGF